MIEQKLQTCLSSSAAAAQSLNVATRYPITAREKHCINTQHTIDTIGLYHICYVCGQQNSLSNMAAEKKTEKSKKYWHSIYQKL